MTCTSTLAWQPSFDSHFFFSKLFFFLKKGFISISVLTEFFYPLNQHFKGLFGPTVASVLHFKSFFTSFLPTLPLTHFYFEKIWKAFFGNFAEKFQNITIPQIYSKPLNTPTSIKKFSSSRPLGEAGETPETPIQFLKKRLIGFAKTKRIFNNYLTRTRWI